MGLTVNKIYLQQAMIRAAQFLCPPCSTQTEYMPHYTSRTEGRKGNLKTEAKFTLLMLLSEREATRVPLGL